MTLRAEVQINESEVEGDTLCLARRRQARENE